MNDTTNLFQIALNISDPWFIEKIVFEAEHHRLDIYVDFKKGTKFSYTDSEIQGVFPVHDTINKKWRHLNFFQYECYLHARIPRVKINDTQAKLIQAPWEGINNGFTLLFEVSLLQLCKNMTIQNVGKIVNESDDKLWQMLDKYVELTRATSDYSDITVVGIDETSRTKGHDYITLFVDLKSRKTIYVTKGKDSKTIENFVIDLSEHKGSSKNITDVSCDMSPAFIKGVSENLPNAHITFDKFHVIKIVNEAVDEVRKSESSKVQILKGTKYIFLKNVWNLTKKQEEKLKAITMSNLNLDTMKAYQIRQAFQEIYKAKTKETFLELLNKWYLSAIHSNLEPIKAAAKTIKDHWDGIVQWKNSQINNGILEGLNSVIQAAKSRARGYKTLKNLKNIVYLLTGKLNFEKINPYYSDL